MTENANAAEAPRSSNEGVTEAGNSGRNRFGYRGGNRRNNRGRRNNNGFKNYESMKKVKSFSTHLLLGGTLRNGKKKSALSLIIWEQGTKLASF